MIPGLLVLSLEALTGAVSAQVGGRGLRDLAAPGFDPRAPDGMLQVERSVHLESVMPAELLASGGARAIAAGAFDPDRAPAGAFELDAHVVRSIPALWRMHLDDAQSATELGVRCEIRGTDGQVDLLTHAQDPHSVIHVWARALSPQIQAGAAEGVVVEGGVLLDLDLRGVRTAGPHSGILTVTVEHY